MSDHICLPKTHIIIIFAVFIGLSVWYIHNDKKYHLDEPRYKFNDSVIDTINKKILDLSNSRLNEIKNTSPKRSRLNEIKNISPEKIRLNKLKNRPPIQNHELERSRFIQERDQKVLYNEFVAPERRQQKNSYPLKQVRNMINLPTRGIPDTYHLVGLLLRNNTETAFKLFGRQKFPGSNQWEYYVHGVMSNNDVKIPIVIRGEREIEDGQTIVVPGTDHGKGGFKVKLYNFDLPRYNPYDY